MSELNKTAAFLAAGVVSLLVAWVARPAAPERRAVDDSGERFFASFDPLDAADLEISELDAESAERRTFRVARRNGVWSIPSHEDYPSDAESQMASAAAAIVDLVRGPSVSESPADHELFGVRDPLEAELGATGYGVRVSMNDGAGGSLADLIVGKADETSPGVRFVRTPGRDRVYRAEIDTTALSTKFEDWIERDLLQLAPASVSEVLINQYSIDEVNSRIIPGDVLELEYDSVGSSWLLKDLAADESLDSGPLDAMRTALGDLEIVDVRRKPAGLSAELASDGNLQLDAESVRSLQARGYYISGGQLLSNEGEIWVTMSDGVQYQLRFGQIVADDRSVEGFDGADGETGDEATGNVAPEEADILNRYLFVSCVFSAAAVLEPEYEALPEERTAETDAETDTDTETATETEEDSAAATAALVAERERILDDNQEKVDEYEARLEAGRARVAKLNERFADWYYVISDEVYRQIRVNRADVVVDVPPPSDAAGPLPESDG